MRPIFRFSVRRTPPTARERVRECGLQRGAIHTRLSAGDNFEKGHVS